MDGDLSLYVWAAYLTGAALMLIEQLLLRLRESSSADIVDENRTDSRGLAG